MRVRSLVAVSLVAAVLLPGALGPGPAQVTVPLLSMQEDPQSPLWGALRGLGHTPAEWAVLLTSDADANGRTDFLDLAMVHAALLGRSATPVELLVRADPAARATLLSTWPGAVAIESAGAVFLTARLDQVQELQRPGVSLVVWEPRASVSASTNPAGGSPSTMPQHAISQVGTAWGSNYHGSGIRIAILDTGVDAGHQSLSGGKVSAWKDCVSNLSPAYDNNGHGTHVASIAAGNDSTDFKGVADQASIVGVKIMDAGGSGTIGWFRCGIDYVLTGGAGSTPAADVASMSAGLTVPPLSITTLNGGPFDLFGWDAEAERLPAGDIPFAVAAGNWIGTVFDEPGVDETTRVGVNGVNQVSSPAYSPAVIAVGAVDQLQAPATFTALGPGPLPTDFKPDVAAQGAATWGALAGTGNSYEQWDGTSMATPIAAGVLAILVGKNGSHTHIQYEWALRNGAFSGCVISSSSTTCTLRESPRPNYVMGFGVVKAANSLPYV